ncbi:MAG: hypothetical protein RL033_7851 [Pseudomonadota bacterium]
MAGLSPADIASPIRSLFSGSRNVRVVQADVNGVDLARRQVKTTVGAFDYDYAVLATGAQHAYFGNEQWEDHAPGLKSLEQATEIRRRVLTAFERAECEKDPTQRRALLTFAVIGGGPTGVELAGAIGEMTRFTLARDFHNIDPKLTRIVLVEAGPRILPSFEPELASRAARELEQLGVQVWVNSRVTEVSASGLRVGEEHLRCSTVIWGAGVQASALGKALPAERDPQGRVVVGQDLSIANDRRVFVIGDQAHFRPEGSERALPGVASVAIQQGRYVARTILADQKGSERTPFVFRDKGQMATIGRRRAVLQLGAFRTSGAIAWGLWLLVHIYFLSGFRNRLFVLMHWCWSYLTFSRGARLIVEKHWHSYGAASQGVPAASLAPAPAPAQAAASNMVAPHAAAPHAAAPHAAVTHAAVTSASVPLVVEPQQAHPGAAAAPNVSEPPMPNSSASPESLPGAPVLSQRIEAAAQRAGSPEEWWDEPTRWIKPEPSPRDTSVRRSA